MSSSGSLAKDEYTKGKQIEMFFLQIQRYCTFFTKSKDTVLKRESYSIRFLILFVLAAVSMAERNKDFVIGFICQSKLTNDPDLIHMMPGLYTVKALDSCN